TCRLFYLRAEDRFVVLNGVEWKTYCAVRELFDSPGIRMTYLRGALEIMSPSRRHEAYKTIIGRLIELFALERDVPLFGYGSTTFRKALAERGLEPDECYVVGREMSDDEYPDIALEVVLTSGGIQKLEVYRGLGVHEVWFWEQGQFRVFWLGDSGYEHLLRFTPTGRPRCVLDGTGYAKERVSRIVSVDPWGGRRAIRDTAWGRDPSVLGKSDPGTAASGRPGCRQLFKAELPRVSCRRVVARALGKGFLYASGGSAPTPPKQGAGPLDAATASHPRPPPAASSTPASDLFGSEEPPRVRGLMHRGPRSGCAGPEGSSAVAQAVDRDA
ncbi:Uma2 family endonuclease, partial [Myxococcota bacterium]